MKFIKRLFCKHEYEFVRNIYGDEINMVGGRRSWWRCKKCGKWRPFEHLQPEPEAGSGGGQVSYITPEQAIEATLGRETCKVECFDDGVDEGLDGEWYSYSPPTWYLSCGHTCEGLEGPDFCPNCGRRVVDE